MTFRIRIKKDVKEKQTMFQREQNADELNKRQKSKQILTKIFKNQKMITLNNDVYINCMNESLT